MKNRKTESIEIFTGSKGYVDIAYPINISEKQKDAFIKLLKEIYDPRVIKEIKIEQFTRDWRIGEKIMYPRTWMPEEYLVLLDCEKMERAMELLGRTWYACELKDADWRYKLISFCDKNGYDLSSEDKLEIIKKFMKSQEDFKKNKASLRKEQNKLKKELDRLNSPELEKHFAFLERLGKLQKSDIDKHWENKRKIFKRLEDIEKELNKTFDEK